MLEVKKLKKKFGKNVVLKDISFNVSKGDIISIVGPSGSGKSTLLRCLNFIEKPNSGNIIFEGISLMDRKTDLSLVRQKMGMVFQQFNLFPHLTVIENIILAPVKLKLMDEVTARKKALDLLDTINLKDKAEHYPTAMQGLGYKEVVEYLEGKTSKEEMIEKIKQETRRYAKRQLTWFRKNKQTIWLDAQDKIQNNINIILEGLN